MTDTGGTFATTYTIQITGTSDAATMTIPLLIEIANPCVDPDYNNVLVPVDYSVIFNVMKDPLDIVYSDSYFVILASICGGIDFGVVSGTSTEIVDDPLATTLTVYTEDFSLVGTSQTVVVSSQLTNYPTIAGSSLTITVLFEDCGVSSVTMPTIDAVSYQIGSPAVTFTADSFLSEDSSICNYSWIYSATLDTNPLGGGTMADYITFNPSTLTFNVESEIGTGLA